MGKIKRFCSETDFVKQIQEQRLSERLKKVQAWSKQLPDHEKYYSCKTNRISFRLPGGKKAFLTIIFKRNDFIYLLNGTGVDMNNQKNWNKEDDSIFQRKEFIEEVKVNYDNR